MKRIKEKPLVWIGTTLEDLRKFPKQVRCEIGYALDVAQNGGKADHVKPLKGIVPEVAFWKLSNGLTAILIEQFTRFVWKGLFMPTLVWTTLKN